MTSADLDRDPCMWFLILLTREKSRALQRKFVYDKFGRAIIDRNQLPPTVTAGPHSQDNNASDNVPNICKRLTGSQYS